MRLSHRALVALGGVCTKARAANLKDPWAGCALFLVTAMQHDFREGDLVRHQSCAVPIRVIGIGATIAVQFPTGEMRAFEPCELEKVPIAKVPVRKVRGRGSAEQFVLLTSISLIYLVMLAWSIVSARDTRCLSHDIGTASLAVCC